MFFKMAHTKYAQEIVYLNTDPTIFKNYNSNFSKQLNQTKLTASYIKKIIDTPDIKMTPEFLQIAEGFLIGSRENKKSLAKARTLPVADRETQMFGVSQATKLVETLQGLLKKPIIKRPTPVKATKTDSDTATMPNEKLELALVQEKLAKLEAVQLAQTELQRVEALGKTAMVSLPKLEVNVVPEVAPAVAEPEEETVPFVRRLLLSDGGSSVGSGTSMVNKLLASDSGSSLGSSIVLNSEAGSSYFPSSGSNSGSYSGSNSGSYSGSNSGSYSGSNSGSNSDLAAQTPSVVSTVPSAVVTNVPASNADYAVNSLDDRSVVKYCKIQIAMYFGSVEDPQWDTELKSSIYANIPSVEERILAMDSIINTYKPQLFIEKRKTDSVDEFHELMQLQFCLLRNLQRGSRTKSAMVPISSLISFAQKLNPSASAPPAAPANDPYVEAATMQDPFGSGGSSVSDSSAPVTAIDPVIEPIAAVQVPISVNAAMNKVIEEYRARPYGIFGKPIIDESLKQQTRVHNVNYIGSQSMRDPTNLSGIKMAKSIKIKTMHC
jgi:hypothetical protein